MRLRLDVEMLLLKERQLREQMAVRVNGLKQGILIPETTSELALKYCQLKLVAALIRLLREPS